MKDNRCNDCKHYLKIDKGNEYGCCGFFDSVEPKPCHYSRMVMRCDGGNNCEAFNPKFEEGVF